MIAPRLAVLVFAVGLLLGLSLPRGATPPGPFPPPSAVDMGIVIPPAVAASRRLAPEIPDALLAQVLPPDLPTPPVVPTSVSDALAASACLVPFEAGAAYVAHWREASVATRLAACRCERRAVHALDGMATLSRIYAEQIQRGDVRTWTALQALWLRHGADAGAACLALFGASRERVEQAWRDWGRAP